MQLSADDEDILKEIANIGAGNAVEVLSRYLNRKVYLEISEATVFSSSDSHRLVNQESNENIVVFAGLQGDSFAGFYALPMDWNSNITLISKVNPSLTPDAENLATYEKMTKDIGQEIFNAYSQSLKDFLNFRISCDSPDFLLVDHQNVLREVFTLVPSDQLLMVSTGFYDQNSVSGCISMCFPAETGPLVLRAARQLLGGN